MREAAGNTSATSGSTLAARLVRRIREIDNYTQTVFFRFS